MDMKKNALGIALAAIAACAALVSAASPVGSGDAKDAVAGWINLRQALGGEIVAAPASVAAYDGAGGKGKFYVVSLEGGGYVATSGDDALNPVIAYSKTGEFDPDPENPLVALLAADAAAQSAAIEAEQAASSAAGSSGARPLGAGGPSRAAANAAKWNRLRAAAAPSGVRPLGAKIGTPADLRVDSFVMSRWNQQTARSYNGYTHNYYNYFVPGKCPCGCVATAGAQAIRYFEWPAAQIEPRTFACSVNGVATNLTMKGGTYDWSHMPYNPSTVPYDWNNVTGIAKLTYDVGVSVGMSYSSSGSGAATVALAPRLTGVFGYSNAVFMYRSAGIGDSDFRKIVLSNLDAKRPVICAVSGYATGDSTRDSGHAILADGYGYSGEDNDLYVHFNMGWGGSSDTWYTPAELNTSSGYTYTSFKGFVFNIFTEETQYSPIASGRVTDENGNPVSGATVQAKRGGAVAAAATSDSRGVYALILPPSGSAVKYSVSASAADHYESSVVSVTASRTTSDTYYDGGSVTLNGSRSDSYGNDIVLQSKTDAEAPYAVSGGSVPADTTIFPGETRSLTLACATAGATIRYTTDGSEPTSSSAVYSSPIAVSGTMTVKARAFKSGFNDSCTFTLVYTAVERDGNLVLNGDFEAGGIASGSYGFSTDGGYSNPHWTDGRAEGLVGLTKASASAFAAPASADRIGTYAGVIRTYAASTGGAWLEQSFRVPEAGFYKFAFDFAGGYGAVGIDTVLTLTQSGTTLKTATLHPSSADFAGSAEVLEIAAGGVVTLRFAQGAAASDGTKGKAIAIDNVVFEKAKTLAAPATSTATTFSGSAEIVLECEDGATIYYTLDGTEPGASSLVYAGPFTVSGTTTVKAVAMKPGSIPSAVFTQVFTDTTESQPDAFAASVSGGGAKYVATGLTRKNGSYVEFGTVSCGVGTDIKAELKEDGTWVCATGLEKTTGSMTADAAEAFKWAFPDGENRPSPANVRYLRVWQVENGTYVLKRYFVPCVKYSKGAFYDEASRTVFRSAAGGDFGFEPLPDFLPHAYVQSFGENFVDTGYTAGANDETTVDFQYLSIDAQARIYGVYDETKSTSSNKDRSGIEGFVQGLYINGSTDGQGKFAYARFGTFVAGGSWMPFDVDADTVRRVFSVGNIESTSTGSVATLAEYPDGDPLSKQCNMKHESAANYSTHLFGNNPCSGTNHRYSKAKIYSFACKSGGTPAAFFAPARDPATGRAGFRNVVDGTFHGDGNASAALPLLFIDGVGTADDYRHENGSLDVKYRLKSSDPSLGTVECGGAAVQDGAAWTAWGSLRAITAVPAPGAIFVKWEGDVWAIASGGETSPGITVASDTPVQLRALFDSAFSPLDTHASVASSGEGGVDTGYMPVKASKFTADFFLTEVEKNSTVFGCHRASSDVYADIIAESYVNGSGAFAFILGSVTKGHWTSTGYAPDSDVRYVFTLESTGDSTTEGSLYAGDRSRRLNSTYSDTSEKYSAPGEIPVWMFCSGTADGGHGRHSKSVFHSFRIEEDGVLKKFFAPCSQEDVPGFKELVSGAFFPDSTGSAGGLVYADGVGRASDYRYDSAAGKLSAKFYARSLDMAKGLVKFEGGEPAGGTNALWTVNGATATLEAFPSADGVFERWEGDTWAIASGSAATPRITVKSDTAIMLSAVFSEKWNGAAFAKRLEDFSAADYVQDGLLANFDGIENAGAGLPHDPAAATWKNLASSGPAAAELYSGGSAYESAGRTWSGGNGYALVGDCYWQLQSPGATLPKSAATIQFVTEIDPSVQQAGSGFYPEIFHINNGNGSDADDLGVFLNNSGGTATSKLLLKSDAYSGTVASTRPAVDSWGGRYATAILDADRVYLFEDAVRNAGVARTSSPADGVTSCFSWGGTVKTTPSKRTVKGVYHSVRLYGRALSNAELAYNRMIDGIRFFGEGFVTNVIVASDRIGPNALDGAYMVRGAATFSAAPQTDAAGNSWVATGYMVEKWNASLGVWEKTDEGTGNAYAFADPDSAAPSRLVWKWRMASGVKKIGAGDYIQSGLILAFDGESNAGLGDAHDPSASTWANLGSLGPGWNATLETIAPSKSGSPDTNRYPVAEGEWTASAYRFQSRNWFSIPELVLGDKATVQIAADCNESRQYTAYPCFFSRRSEEGTGFYIFARREGGADAYDNRGDRVEFADAFAGTTYATRSKFTEWDGRFLTAMHDGNSTWLFAGVEPENAATGSRTSTFIPAAQYDIGARTEGDRKNHVLSGDIHSIRVYARTLGADELRHNRNVDLVRFYGTTSKSTDTDLVEVRSGVAAVAVPDAGCWIVRGEGVSKTFSVPAAVESGGSAWECAGWLVEEWNGSAWVDFASGDGTSCTMAGTAGGTGNRRLTWLWTRTKGLLTAADYTADSYVKHGLAAHYDAISNMGLGQPHAMKGVYWRDLSGNGNDLVALADKNAAVHGNWMDSAMHFSGAETASPMHMLCEADLGICCTIEAALDAKPDEQKNIESVDYPNYIGVSGDDDMAIFWGQGSEVLQAKFDAIAGTTADLNSHPRPRLRKADHWEGKYIAFASTEDYLYLSQSGEYGTGAGKVPRPDKSKAFAGIRFSVGGPGPGTPEATLAKRVPTCDFHSARFYNRALSGEELAQNRKVDAIRYSGAFGDYANLTVVNEPLPDGTPAAGSIPGGEYELVGEKTFTAAPVVSGGVAHSPAYLVETRIEGEWTVVSSAIGDSVTIGGSATKTRLTWRWIDLSGTEEERRNAEAALDVATRNKAIAQAYAGDGYAEAGCTALADVLSGRGANGIPAWQSMCLGLDAGDPSSRVLCESPLVDVQEGTVAVKVKNIAVPEGLAGVAVSVVLECNLPGSEVWTPCGDAVTPTPGVEPVVTVEMPAGADLVFFRARARIDLQK